MFEIVDQRIVIVFMWFLSPLAQPTAVQADGPSLLVQPAGHQAVQRLGPARLTSSSAPYIAVVRRTGRGGSPTTAGNNTVDSVSIFPEWIWSSERRDHPVSAVLTKEFAIDASAEISSAVLRAFADFNRMTVFLNGRTLAEVADFGSVVSVDAAQALKSGQNLISVRSLSREGPAAIAVALEVRFKNGMCRTIASDATWRVSKRNAATPRPNQNLAETAVSFGKIAEELWAIPVRAVGINELDDYTQWKQALSVDEGSDPSTFLIPDGFQIELLRSAQADEGSWIGLEFDPRGRLVIAREDKGLFRLTIPQGQDPQLELETINDTLLECRGLLFAFGNLYVNANNSKGFYRLRDTNGDDQFDEVKLLFESGGSVGHGRNALALGPDKLIYLIHGDAVDLPTDFTDRTSPFREHRRGIKTREGHVIRTDRDGTRWEVLTAGLRNPFGIDFNTDGEMFTYDADAEHDMGAPWYRPTRVDHLVVGGDFGWRGVTGKWPVYYPDHPDNAIPNLDIGKGSPTGIRFGTNSNFPPKLREALFILDWAYGRIIAVHMTPRGASYVCRGETFIKGRPLNVTNLTFGPDGAMYFVTGGRKTQSALYRVRYVGPHVDRAQPTLQQVARSQQASHARKLRRKLESYHGKQDSQIVDEAWPHLESQDPWIRHAARLAVEHQPLDAWRQLALAESRPTAAVSALMALARSGKRSRQQAVVERLNEIALEDLNVHQKSTALYAYSLCIASPADWDSTLLSQVIDHLDPLYPDHSIMSVDAARLNRTLSQLLIQLDAPGVVPRTLALLRKSTDQKQQLHYLYVLRTAKRDWGLDSRREYFKAIQQAKYFQGGAGMPEFINRIQDDAIRVLSKAEREQIEPLIAGMKSEFSAGQQRTEARAIVREWSMDELETALAAVGKHRDFKNGQNMFRAALCADCHRLGTEGRPIGPDLTSVSRRFSRRDVLTSILSPSAVVAEQYRTNMIVTAEGKILTGRVVLQNDFRSPELLIATDPLRPWTLTKIAKVYIESHKTTPLSTMPKGLLNTLTRDDILDLLAYVEAAGQPRHQNFQP